MKEVKRVWKNVTLVRLYMKKNKIKICTGGDICFFPCDPISYLPHPSFSFGSGHPALLLRIYPKACHFGESSSPVFGALSPTFCTLGTQRVCSETPVHFLCNHTPLSLPGPDFSFSAARRTFCCAVYLCIGTHSRRHMDCRQLPLLRCNLQGWVFYFFGSYPIFGSWTIAGTQNIFVLNKCPH